MHCPRCGSTVERGRTLCPTCKEPLGAAIALAAAQAAAEARPGEMASQPRTLQMPAIKLPMAPRATLASPTAEALHDQPEGSVTIKLDLAPASPRVQSFEDEPSVTLRLDVIADSVAADSVAADSEEATRKTAPLPTSSVPRKTAASPPMGRSEEHTSELQSR